MLTIKTKGLGKIYRGYRGFLRKRETLALKDLNLEIERGEVFGLLGLNGAGKTTVLKILLGFTPPSWGEFELLGEKDINNQVKKKIGFLPEDPNLYDFLSAEQFLDFCGKLFSLSLTERKMKTERLLELLSLTSAKKIPVKEFSKGMIQRLGIASSLINDPELVFFDEPLSGLDPLGRKRVKDVILNLKEKNKTVFFSSHILAEVEEICDRIGILHKGKLIASKDMEEITAEEVSLEEFFLQIVKNASEETLNPPPLNPLPPREGR